MFQYEPVNKNNNNVDKMYWESFRYIHYSFVIVYKLQ